MNVKPTKVMWVAVAGALAIAVNVSAGVLHQWEFSEASGTTLSDAVDSAGGAVWLGGVASTEMGTDGSGNLSFGNTTNVTDAYLPLANPTTGSRFVRIDYSGWDLGTTNGDEQISFYFEGSGNVRMELLRWADSRWELTGWSQSNHLASVKTFTTAGGGPVSTVLEVDIDQLRYRLWWGDGSVFGWSGSAWAPAWPNLAVNQLRFRKAGDFSQPGDYVHIDRITVADQLSDAIGLPPYPENLVAGWVDDSGTGTATAPGVGLRVDVSTGGAHFDSTYQCDDRFYGPDGNPAYSTGPDDVSVSAVTFQSNQYVLVTITNESAERVTLKELRFDWGARFNGSPRFFYLNYEAGDLAGVANGATLWSITDFLDSPPASANVDDYNDASIDLTTLADNTLDVGEYATFRIEVDEFGDSGKSLVDNIGFFGTVPRVSPVITNLTRSTVLVPVEVILVDVGNDTSWRGLSVVNPDQNGNYWNSVWSGAYYEDLLDINGNATDVNLGFSSATGTDSYNGPAGPTDAGTGPLTSVVHNTDIDVEALGRLGATNAVFDFYVSSTFEIQELDPTKQYRLSFYGAHKYNPADENTTVYGVYTDNTYSTLVDSVSLLVGEGAAHNRDTVAVLNGLSPDTNNILYVKFMGHAGGNGYLNALQIEATTFEPAAVITWDGAIGTTYTVEEATDIVASNWTGVVTGLVGSGSSMSATVALENAAAAIRVDEIIPPPLFPLFSDDFEGGLNGWASGLVGDAATQWELGAPANVGPVGAGSGTNCWGTNLDSGYHVDAECWLRSPDIDLTSVDAASLNWRQASDMEDPFDWGEVNILDTNNVPIISVLGGKITGEELTPEWTEKARSLDGAVGNVIRIEFRFKSDNWDLRTFAGWYIDDVGVLAP